MGETDDEYECPLAECNFTSGSSQGRGTHFATHDTELKKNVIVSEIHRIGDKIGRAPYARDFGDHSTFSADMPKSIFGSWNSAIKASEYEEYRKRNRPSEEELISEIHRLKEDLGKVPSVHDIRHHSKHCENRYYQEFGSWPDVLKEVGYEANKKRRKYGKQKLIDDLLNVEEQIGETPTEHQYNNHGKFHCTTIINTFGSWNDGLTEAGLPLNNEKNIKESRVINEIQRVKENLGKTPTHNEFNQHSQLSSSTVKNRFGSWNKGLRAAGSKVNKLYGCDISGIYYGSNWRSQRSETISRDDNQCRICGKHSDEMLKTSVHVHHITPAREFDADDRDLETDYKEMNALYNLICLCPSCHGGVEGKFQDASPDEFSELARDYLDIDPIEQDKTISPATDQLARSASD